MKTYLDCIPCLIKGALEQARLATDDERVQKEIINEAAALIPQFSLGLTPPEMARQLHQIIARKTGSRDLFKSIRARSNRWAMELYPKLKEKVVRSRDRLLTSVELAIAGNVIDYAIKNTLNIEEEIQKIFGDDFSQEYKGIFEYECFKKDIATAKTILYLADNAGEIVFDRVFIEEFCGHRKVVFAVRDKPSINDALMEDAVFCGLDKITHVMSSGVDAPGTILKYCSEEFLKIFQQADLIISKGQGNYEALSEAERKIYFLFKVKCPVIARHSGAKLGDIVLKRSK